MPSRLIREGILSSDRVDQLSSEAEVFYRRLLSKVDDYGLFDARPSVLVSSLYPLRLKSVTEDHCIQWMTDCINAKLVIVYQIDGKPFVKALDTKWTTRSEPKWPKPTHTCKQLKAPVLLDVVVDVVRCRSIEVVDVVVVETASAKTGGAEGALPAEASHPVDKTRNGNGKDLDARAAALGIAQRENEPRNMFMLRVASEEAKARGEGRA